MNRRHVMLSGGCCLGILMSGCLGETPRQTPGSSNPTAERSTAECDAATRPATPAPDAEPPGEARRYTYPDRPNALSNQAMRTFVERYERAYRLNKLYSQYGRHLNQASVTVEDTTTFDAPEGAAIVQVKYEYEAEIDGDDGPIEIDSPLLYAAYYVDDEEVLRAVDNEYQEDTSRLIADPREQGQPVGCV